MSQPWLASREENLQNVLEEGPDAIRLAAIEDNVRSGDHSRDYSSLDSTLTRLYRNACPS